MPLRVVPVTRQTDEGCGPPCFALDSALPVRVVPLDNLVSLGGRPPLGRPDSSPWGALVSFGADRSVTVLTEDRREARRARAGTPVVDHPLPPKGLQTSGHEKCRLGTGRSRGTGCPG